MKKNLTWWGMSPAIRKTLLVMKLSLIIVLVSSLQLSASVLLGQQVSVSSNEASLRNVLEDLHEQTGTYFMYNESDLNASIFVDLDMQNVSLEEALDEICLQIPFEYEIIEDFVVFKKIEPVVEKPAAQQEKTIKGKVIDEFGNTLPGVSVVVKGTTNGVATDIDGNYTINIEGDNTVLVYSFVGMISQEVAYNGQASINVTMKSDSEQMDEIVIVGYGKVDKRDLTGSVATVKAENLSLIKTSSIETALAGQVTGLHIASNSGKPGQGSVVHIRGLSQIKGDNQPLYVVDGVPIVVNPSFGGGLDRDSQSSRENPLLAIHPDNVERVDVLKDASAAGIYGSRGANGVILITTKRGKKNQATKFSFSSNATIQNPVNTYNYMGAEEWISNSKEQAVLSMQASGLPESLWPVYLGTAYGIANNPDYFGTADTDWQDKITNKNALWTQHSINVSGGTDKVSFMLSTSIADQDGIMIGNNFKRYNFSSNIDAEITDNFKVGGSINYNYSKNKTSGVNSLDAGNFRPDKGVYNEDGSYSSYPHSYFGFENRNPIGGVGKNRNENISKSMFGTIYGEYEIIKDLKLKSQLSVSVNDSKARNFTPSFNRLFYALAYNEPGATLNSNTNSSWSTSFENTLSYNKTINEVHRFNAVVGLSWDRMRQDMEGHRLRIFPDDEYLTNQNSASIIETPTSYHTDNGLNSVFGRFNYIYDNRYLATFTARRDGSTKFGPGNKQGFFPSGALAWNMHNESFMDGLEVVDKLKLRSSLGRTGSDNLPSFTYLAYYQAGSKYDGKNGLSVTGIPNENIKWESTDQIDLGLEVSLFNYRINAEIVYFEKNTSDIILLAPITYETGESAWNTNIADVSNKGWEFALNGDILRGDFTWNSSFNISFIENKVERLKGGATESYGSRGIVEGKPIGVITGYDVLKIAQTQEEITELDAAAGGQYYRDLTQPGDYIYKDLDGDNKITANDKTKIGDVSPDFFGGWNNQFSYKNFTLGMNWVYSYGAEKQYRAIDNMYYIDFDKNFDKIVKDTWTPEKTDAPYARWGSGSHYGTSKSVVDASYIKLSSLSLAYELPKSLLDKLGLSRAKLSISGNNLLTITDYPGLDPQDVSGLAGSSSALQTSDDGYSYPNARTFTVGLNVTF